VLVFELKVQALNESPEDRQQLTRMRVGGKTSFVVGQAPLEQSSVVLVNVYLTLNGDELEMDSSHQQLLSIQHAKISLQSATS